MIVLSASILLVWFIVSLLSQVTRVPLAALKSRDVFSLLPRWSFFAPRPGTFDYHLLFRDYLTDGSYSAWQELPLADQRTISGALWNPEKRCRKVLSDIVRSLIQLRETSTKSAFVMSIPYLITLNYISSVEHNLHAQSTQFMILRTDGFLTANEPRLVFKSDLHRL